MATAFHFEHVVAFAPEQATEVLRGIPALPGVFALRGARETDEPYLTRTADLRRRATRLLAPPDSQTKRLNLRDRVATIEYCVTGSDFESLLVLHNAATKFFGAAEARRRLRLNTPFCVRLTTENAHPRLYATNRLGRRNLAQMYGPFPSRAAAERYVDAVLDLFQLRRCFEDLQPYPEHPGCAYGEMKRCMAPCNLGCTGAEYAAEAASVEAFLRTGGESMLAGIAADRERASAEMEFEQAAALHERYQKVKAAAGLADELVRPLPQVRAVVVEAAADDAARPEAQEAALFLFENGCLAGPVRMSTLGVRAVKEQTSVGSSLFAQPLMLEAVPLDGAAVAPSDSPEVRAAKVLAELAGRTLSASPPASAEAVLAISDHLSLLRRWYYRPEKQRVGEVFLPNPDGSWPLRRILRGAARMVLGDPKPMAETQRDQVDAAKVKILHEGREGVERVVPVISRRKR